MQPIFTSMVAPSDTGELLDRFFAVPAPKMFMFGEQDNGLTYLPELDRRGVELAEIADCAHFPMSAVNAPQMWRRISCFVTALSV